MHYLLFYDVVPNYLERRVPLRAAHLAHARGSARRARPVRPVRAVTRWHVRAWATFGADAANRLPAGGRG